MRNANGLDMVEKYTIEEIRNTILHCKVEGWEGTIDTTNNMEELPEVGGQVILGWIDCFDQAMYGLRTKADNDEVTAAEAYDVLFKTELKDYDKTIYDTILGMKDDAVIDEYESGFIDLFDRVIAILKELGEEED